METLLQQKRQLETLQVEFKYVMSSSFKFGQEFLIDISNFRMSIGSNVEEMKEESSIHQMLGDVDMVDIDQDPQPSLEQEEAHIKHVFD